MKTIVNCCAIVLLTLTLSCTKENSSCPESMNYGELIPTEFASSTFPYKSNSRILFSDSLGNTIEFTTSEKYYISIPWKQPGHCQTNYDQMIYHTYDSYTWMIEMQNDSINLLFDVRVAPKLDYKTTKVYDLVTVERHVGDTLTINYLNIVCDRRKLSDDELHLKMYCYGLEDTITIYGNTFNNVYHLNQFDDYYEGKIYYNYEFGILSFRDDDGTRWVYEGVIEE